jgi:hypothetical protein
MDVKIPWKALSKQDASSPKRGAFSLKWGAFSLKQIVFLVVVGVALVAGILLRSGQFFGQPEVEQNGPVTVAAPPPAATPPPPAAAPMAPAAALVPPAETTESSIKTPQPAPVTATPSEQAGQTGEAADQTEQVNETVGDTGQPESAGSGAILVSRQPIAMLAGPSSSAPTLYGFPAGRPFRVIGHSGGFAQIKDLRSGASGWIDETALAPPPGLPSVYAPSQSKPVAVSRQSAGQSAVPNQKVTKKGSQVTTGSEEATDQVTPRRPGLFGRGGLFGGIFGGGN